MLGFGLFFFFFVTVLLCGLELETLLLQFSVGISGVFAHTLLDFMRCDPQRSQCAVCSLMALCLHSWLQL